MKPAEEMSTAEIRAYLIQHDVRFHIRVSGTREQKDRAWLAMGRLVVHLHQTHGANWIRQVAGADQPASLEEFQERQAKPRMEPLL